MKEDILHWQDTSPPTIPRIRLLPITGLSGAVILWAWTRPVMDGIVREWHLLAPLKKRADLVIDTSSLTAGKMRALIDDHFRCADFLGLTVPVISFSYRLGLPREAGLVFNVRFIANPRCVDGFRPLTGNDSVVGAYVVTDPECEPFLESFDQMLQTLIPL